METIRAIEWGHWSIRFYLAQPKQSAFNPGVTLAGDAVQFIAELPFAVVNGQGPIDGHYGSSTRRHYESVCRTWRESGELPAGALCFISQKWLYQA